MLEKNYTNPEGIGRFSFSESGKFRAPYKSEGLYVFAVVFIAAILETALLIFALNFLHSLLGVYQDQGAVFSAMTSAVVIGVGTVVILLAAGLIIANLHSGIKCTYSATEEKFVVTVGGDTNVINYNEVQSIVFTPRYFLGKVKGYDVDITILNKVYRYAVCFSGQYQSEKTTPFYIIKERVEMIQSRRSDEAALYAQQKIGADKPIDENDIVLARLRKKHSDDIFPPTMNRQPVEEEKPAPTMDSIAPKASSKPLQNTEIKTAASEQMPALKARKASTVGAVNNEPAKPETPKMSMDEIAPKSKRPSSDIFDRPEESAEPETETEEDTKKNG